MKTHYFFLASSLLLVPACGGAKKQTKTETITSVQPTAINKESVDVKDIYEEPITIMNIEENPTEVTTPVEEIAIIEEEKSADLPEELEAEIMEIETPAAE